MPVTINVNGTDRAIDAEPDTPLLWAIRDHAGLTGTKFGCGMALCGACTVHLDGEPVRSCTTPLSAVGDRRVTTIEGIRGGAGRAGRLGRARRAAVRLLPVRPDHVRRGAAGDECLADR